MRIFIPTIDAGDGLQLGPAVHHSLDTLLVHAMSDTCQVQLPHLLQSTQRRQAALQRQVEALHLGIAEASRVSLVSSANVAWCPSHRTYNLVKRARRL